MRAILGMAEIIQGGLAYIDKFTLAITSPALIPAKTASGESDLQSRGINFSDYTFIKGNEKKAAVAVAHTLLCIAWAVMKHGGDYTEAGADYYDRRDRRNHEHLVRHHQQALTRLGYQVTLTPPGDGSPPPGPGTPPAAPRDQAA